MISRITAVTGKEFKHLFRDPRMLAIVLAMPVMQLLLFAYAISFDVRNVPTFVVDNDNTVASRAYISAFTASGIFVNVGQSSQLSAVDEVFTQNKAEVALLIEAGFSKALTRGESAQVGILVDGSAPNSAKVARGAAIGLSARYGQQLTIRWASENGYDLSSVGGLEPRVRTWYNPEIRSSDFLIPGLMIIIIMIVTVQQTAITLVRERDQGTAEQLQVSPLRQWELMLGKLLPWTLLAFVDLVAITTLAITVFDVSLRGSIFALALGATLFTLSGLGLGLVISAIAPTMETANFSAMLIALLPSFLLSDFAFPLDQIPEWIEWLSRLFPCRYMVAVAREVFLKGSGFAEIWPQLVSLGIFALVVFAAASVLYKRRRS